MRLKFALIGTLLVLLNVACTRSSETYTIWGPYKPSDMKLACGQDNRCPNHQGMLFGFKQTQHGSTVETRIQRCTASLFAKDRVLTAGHCQMAEMQEIYFLPVAKPGFANTMVAAVWDAGVDDIKNSRDFGSFRLASPIEGRELVKPANGVGPDFADQTAFVVNGVNDNNFVLEAKDCHNYPNKVSAATVDKNPYAYVVQDCRLISGNSGGILVLKHRPNEVLGIISSGPKEVSLKDLMTRMETVGVADWTNVVNARCFELPGWPRVEPHCFNF